MFEEEQITLDIPEEGIMLESGWTITPLTHPGVSSLLHQHITMHVYVYRRHDSIWSYPKDLSTYHVTFVDIPFCFN